MHSEVCYDSGAKWSLAITRYCSLDPWILTPLHLWAASKQIKAPC